ncbi:unnamed protein product [Pleuronectes platessa]|uniref:Uncharacterized protein n=1 Tax=Pleuronectes platessa TaxID=8262 RepID=A0A9N7UWH0_PLEPL|nr:unnamed protein product [Pleuronectes platessa]
MSHAKRHQKAAEQGCVGVRGGWFINPERDRPPALIRPALDSLLPLPAELSHVIGDTGNGNKKLKVTLVELGGECTSYSYRREVLIQTGSGSICLADNLRLNGKGGNGTVAPVERRGVTSRGARLWGPGGGVNAVEASEDLIGSRGKWQPGESEAGGWLTGLHLRTQAQRLPVIFLSAHRFSSLGSESCRSKVTRGMESTELTSFRNTPTSACDSSHHAPVKVTEVKSLPVTRTFDAYEIYVTKWSRESERTRLKLSSWKSSVALALVSVIHTSSPLTWVCRAALPGGNAALPRLSEGCQRHLGKAQGQPAVNY